MEANFLYFRCVLVLFDQKTFWITFLMQNFSIEILLYFLALCAKNHKKTVFFAIFLFEKIKKK